MGTMTLKEISKAMRGLDICTLERNLVIGHVCLSGVSNRLLKADDQTAVHGAASNI